MKVPLTILAFFLVTQLLGLYLGVSLIQYPHLIPGSGELKQITPTGKPEDILNAFFFLAYVLFGALIIILLLRFYRGILLFKLLEFSIILTASFIFFYVPLSICTNFPIPPYSTLFGNCGKLSESQTLLLSAFLALFLGISKFILPQLKNLTAVISSAGVGALFGSSIGFFPTLLFVLFLALYDYIAVFKTRHMIVLAKEMTARQLAFSVTAVKPPKKKVVMRKGKKIEKIIEKPERMDLGTGDLAIPLMLAVSAFNLGGIANSFAVILGSTLALAILLFYVSRYKVLLPALPPICLGGVVTLLAAKVLGF